MRYFHAIRKWWQARVSGNIQLDDYREEIAFEKNRFIANWERREGRSWPTNNLK